MNTPPNAERDELQRELETLRAEVWQVREVMLSTSDQWRLVSQWRVIKTWAAMLGRALQKEGGGNEHSELVAVYNEKRAEADGLREACRELNVRIVELQKELQHWRSNHASVTAKYRALQRRYDRLRDQTRLEHNTPDRGK